MTRLPTIGIVLHDFALGGTERIATRLAAAWAARGAEVTIACGSDIGEMRPLLGADVTVVPAPTPILRGPGSRRRLAAVAAATFERQPVEVAFLPGNFHWTVAPSLARLPRPRRPAVVAQVSAALAKPQRGALRQRGFEARMRWLLHRAAAVVTLSAAAEAEARAIVRGPAVHTIPLPALADEVPPALPAPAARAIVAVGRLVPEKGFDTLLHALAAVPGATLTIVGEGPDRARLEALAAALGIAGRVALPGFAADPRPFLDRARVAALPSRFEGYPAALVEALAAGRPVAATRVSPAVDELLGGEGGRAVPVDDAPALAAALTELLDRPAPAPHALAARVQRHRIGPVADAYLALFAALAEARR